LMCEKLSFHGVGRLRGRRVRTMAVPMPIRKRARNPSVRKAQGKPVCKYTVRPLVVRTDLANHPVYRNRPQRASQPRAAAHNTHGQCAALGKPLPRDSDTGVEDERGAEAEEHALGECELVVFCAHWMSASVKCR
jgi:hypothetical protein